VLGGLSQLCQCVSMPMSTEFRGFASGHGRAWLGMAQPIAAAVREGHDVFNKMTVAHARLAVHSA